MAREIRWDPPGPVALAFMKSDAYFQGIRGPVGSGKSVACAMKLMKLAQEQAPGADGVTRIKSAVIRNTYPELKTTTVETWLQWFPERLFGRFVWTPPFMHYIRFGHIEWDVIFLALDREEDVRKLLSLEVTNAWFNEAREIAKPIIDIMTTRVGRYPRMADGGPTAPCILADTNPPKEDHWWPIIAGEVPVPKYYTTEQARMMVKPEDWEFFNQPEAMREIRDERGFIADWEPNPNAENLKNLPPGYYDRAVQGKTSDWIRVYVGNKLGDDRAGKPVFPGYRADFHRREFDITPLIPVTIGMDFGLTPAAIFCQDVPRETFRVFDELCFVDLTLERLAWEINYRVREWEKQLGQPLRIEFWGDPAGDARSAYDPKGRTAFQILREHLIKARPAPTNDPLIRLEAVSGLLDRAPGGVPALTVHPRCTKIHQAFESGYKYKRRKGRLGDDYEDTPEKNEYSHPMDALQYAVLGAGHGPLLRRNRDLQPVNGRVPFDVFNRPGLAQRSYRGNRL